MNREPITFYLIRLLIGLAFLFFMGMLYWSTLLIEDRINSMYAELIGLKKSLKECQYNVKSAESITKARPHMDPSLPNLLTEDPFYAKTLPTLLGKDLTPKGFFHEATIGRPDNLHPFTNWAHVASWIRSCTVSLASTAFGKFEPLCPDMAIKIEARQRKDYSSPDAIEYWVHLRDDVFWQPLKPDLFPNNIQLAPIFLEKHLVTANDFAFFYDALMNPHVEEAGAIAYRTLFNDIESIDVIDPQTFVVKWKIHSFTDPTGKKIETIKYDSLSLTAGLTPLPAHVLQRYADGSKIIEDEGSPRIYRTNTIWAQNFSNHWSKNIIVSCGPWIFDGMSDREINLIRNNDFPDPLRALAEGSNTQFKETEEASWQAFKTEKIDSYSLQPNQLAELHQFLASDQYKKMEAEGKKIERLDYLAKTYSYIGWNQAKPFFKSNKVRQALTMSIDRQRIIDQNLNGLGIEVTGPFYRYSSSYDESIQPWPYDLARARLQLEEEGWFDSDGDGIIDKMIDGKIVPFRFKLTYFVKNSLSKAICEYISTNLKEVGIECTLNGVDVADLSAAFEDKSFDALALGWALTNPPEDPTQLWHSSGAFEKGSSNAVGFANTEADKIMEALQFERNPEERKRLYFRFNAIIHEQAPYTFLFTPKVVFLYQNYLQNVFIPKDRQDLVPGATVGQPDSSIFWLKSDKPEKP